MSSINLRPAQRVVVENILDNYSNYDCFFINMPTGGGKTLSSLYTLRMIAERFNDIGRTIIAVRTKNEFQPYFRDNKKFNLGLALTCIAGKEEMCNDPLLMKILKELEEVNPCRFCPLYASLLPSDVVIRKIYEDESFLWLKEIKHICPYYSLRASVRVSDAVCVTYPYIFTGRINLLMKDEELESDVKGDKKLILIIDEAHNIDTIPEQYTRTINLKIVERAIKYIEEGLLILEKSPLIELKEIIQSLPESEEERYFDKRKLPFMDLVALSEEVEALSNYILEEKMRPVIYTAIQLKKFYETVSMPDTEVFTSGKGLKVRLLLPTKLVTNLKQYFDKIILMSGTLPPEDYIAKIWGLKGLYIDVESYFKDLIKNKQGIIITNVTSKYEYRESSAPKYAEAITKIVKELDTVKLIVFPSYKYMKRIISLLKEDVLTQSIIEDEKTKIEEVKKMVEEGRVKNILAVAGGKLTEGIEITKGGKSLIEDVVMIGIPYPEVSDYSRKKAEKIATLIGGKEDLYRYMYYIPALMLVKQAIGRAVRSERDKARIWLLDSRYRYFTKDLRISLIPTLRV